MFNRNLVRGRGDSPTINKFSGRKLNISSDVYIFRSELEKTFTSWTGPGQPA